MSLLDVQRVVSRLLTDQDFRNGFVSGTNPLEQGYQLSERELRNLRGMRFDRVEQHARGLAHGRLEMGLKSLPLTEELVHEQLHRHLDRFCREFPPVPEAGSTALVEAQRLCAFLERLAVEGVLAPAWAAELARYEHGMRYLTLSDEAARSAQRVAELNAESQDAQGGGDVVPVSGTHVRTLSFDHAIPEIVADLRRNRMPEPARLDSPLRILMHRTAGTAQVRILKINKATEDLVDACDGHRTLRAIVELVRHDRGEQAADQVAAAIEQLRALNVIGLMIGASPEPACAV